jgi:hypothetical protein
MKIAMWSGPRNISTAMMRSWGNRPDCFVCDEPLYAHYLQVTGFPHPGASETLAAHQTDWRRVVTWLTGEIPEGKSLFYQKQMAHHLLPHIETEWLNCVENCFLIREPEEMLTSLVEFIPQPVLTDTGLPQQWQIFQQILKTRNEIPPVLDARDVLLDPGAMLHKLCDRLGIEFYESMLQWPPGPRATDGAWADFWYAKVYQTTQFGQYQRKADRVPESMQGLLKSCRAIYDRLYEFRLQL